MRVNPGKHLSQAGVSLARRIGETMGPFDRVVTSTLPRAFETAIAMGFAVDAQDEVINSYGQNVEDELPWPQTFKRYAEAAREGGAVVRTMKRLARFYLELLNTIPEGGSALVINHGGVVEMSAVACFLEADYASFGGPIGYCEGVRLAREKDRFVKGNILRVQ